MKLIVVVTDPESEEPIAYAECDDFTDAQWQLQRFMRLFEDNCVIDIRKAVLT